MGLGKLNSQPFLKPQLGRVAGFRAKRPHRCDSRCAVWRQYPRTDANSGVLKVPYKGFLFVWINVRTLYVLRTVTH